MHLFTRWMFLPALMIGWPVTGNLVRADVTDKGEYFSAEAVARANKRIEKAKDRTRKELVIETFKAIPEDRKKDYDEKKKASFFDRWARDRSESMKVNGVYLLLCKEPGRFQIEVGEDTRKRAFTTADREKLVRDMSPLLGAMTKDKNDEALDLAVERVTTSFEDNKPAAPPAKKTDQKRPREERADSGIAGWICPILAILAGVWLLFALVRALSGGGMAGGGGGGIGGGGFFSSLLGGMFGAAAGMWMYNSFFGGSSGLGGSDAYGGGGGDASPGYGNDTDYSGSGGDIGGDAGGGGGGGDIGGGGGDIGGGGGFGGGADF